MVRRRMADGGDVAIGRSATQPSRHDQLPFARLGAVYLRRLAPTLAAICSGVEEPLKQLFLTLFQHPVIDLPLLEFSLHVSQFAANGLLVVVAALGLVHERLKEPLPA